MARRGYTMTPKRRAALRKAQLASARKRRRGINRKHIVAGVVGAAVLGTSLYTGARHRNISRYQKERGLIRKHRGEYLPPKLHIYHHTFFQGHHKLMAGDPFKHKGRHHAHQKTDRVWFTTGGRQTDMSKHMYYGKYQVMFKSVSRKHIADNKGSPGNKARFTTGPRIKGEARNRWVSVKTSDLAGYKIRSHVAPKISSQHRARAKRISALRRAG